MKKTNNKHRYIFLFAIIVFLMFVVRAVIYIKNQNIAVLNPKGPIALKEFHLIVFALVLSLLVVVPVFTLLIIFAWKYRESNTKSKYSPDLDGNKYVETIWWIIPTILIAILAVVAWNSSHALDPYKPLVSNTKPLTIQVVAMDWKWLFIYPEQNIATINYLQIPSNTPIDFNITSDAPMNSFWIPQLGGQIYAMPGMSTQLHLLASGNGTYNGVSANISGQGFAGMTFTARSTSAQSFNNWADSVEQSNNKLSLEEYNRISKPSENNPIVYYANTDPSLYNNIIYKYLVPTTGAANPDNGNRTQTIPNIQQLQSEGMQGMSM